MGEEQLQKPDREYAFAYQAETTERYTTGLGSVLANASRGSTNILAGELVRLQCEFTGGEVKHGPDGVIVLDHKFPSTEGMAIRERISNRAAKIIVGLVGEAHKTVFTPIPKEDLSSSVIARFEEENEHSRGIKYKRTIKKK